ncbi:glutamine-hydrolyzing GMP synthase [Desulfoluna spongiiphila]|uniref:GMP synthase [glutamine-hydrolyzing] n=1 Tax=Desulfoluna spongiiphila TaxID=419481 RepID=A0A1G5DEK9_9BACT|nr:glutamine-hydrolyzing GMP synthase [Desulfoluna spongiiphila]SCY13135.1 GMP synthase (glutamine-hydrolyzing) [Desulfoluna spongiiphila]VVS95178.1 gmp synthase [Desulfoluna spongiiphila]
MILIIDFGSQFNQLIARRVREFNVYCQVDAPNVATLDYIKELKPEGIILSGGPCSIYDENSPQVDSAIFDLGIPVLGICYGMQFMVSTLGGEVKRSDKREYGFAELAIKEPCRIFEGIESPTQCWMSHGDSISKLPEGFMPTGTTDNTPFAAAADPARKFYGLQFHPEVEHSLKGREMLSNFLFDVCGCQRTWTMENVVKSSIEEIKTTVGDKKVILGLSGGVDSTVAAVLIHKAIGRNLTCIFVDNGLMRLNEREKLEESLTDKLDLNIKFVDASERFLTALDGVSDPEQKRKLIGNIFIDVFEDEAAKVEGAEFLGQGTLYPDVIESQSVFGGASDVIKSHHNVGGLPEDMKLKLVEPLKYLFKDEVRALGEEMGIPDDLVWRQPFPGPGLGIRVLGEITKRRLDILREADAIIVEEIKKAGFYKKVWQSFAVLLPIKSVGVMGDQRTYDYTVAMRAVTSKDAMTADWARLPHDLLARISNRVINEVNGVNRMVYDITSKPPGTIEWE